MSEERFDRLENQLNQVIQGMAVMQQNMATKQDLALVQQAVSDIRTDMVVMQENMATKQDLALVQQTVSDIRTNISILGERISSLELTTNIEVRESIRNQRFMINNTNYELANQERASARLQSRVERLEDINRSGQSENPLEET
jgi:hypothetical protein